MGANQQHDRIIALRTAGHSIAETAKLARCSESQVKRVWALHKAVAVDNLSRNQDIAVGLQVILKPRARPTPTWTSMPERTLDFEF
ncbi:helix-turn-helix domain-containing protein [Pseudomonas alloputida]|uniref:helix-turn-helix domain-containing protein n=1 Tax=Pseudomonas alloputida TaxID=1940621 RepID=UPI0033150A2F